MPNISNAEIAKVQSGYARLQNYVARVKASAEIKAGEIKDGIEVVGAPAILGFIRGKMEKEGKTLTFPGTQIDIELALGMALAGAGLMDAFGKYDNDAMMAGYGLLAHYFGQLGRNFGKSGELSLVAGDSVGALPGSMSII